MADFNSSKGKDGNKEKPAKPRKKMLFIPANNSSTGFLSIVAIDSEGRGLIFPKQKATHFHNLLKVIMVITVTAFAMLFNMNQSVIIAEQTGELVEIERPCLSAVLSGTPKQIGTLIPNAENGLFSRFMFYVMNIVTRLERCICQQYRKKG